MNKKITNPKVGERVVPGPSFAWRKYGDPAFNYDYGVIEHVDHPQFLMVKWVSSTSTTSHWHEDWKNDELEYLEPQPAIKDTEFEYLYADIAFMKDAYQATQRTPEAQKWGAVIEKAVAESSFPQILNLKVAVKRSLVEEALSDPSICENWKVRIRVQFPSVRPKEEYANFGKDFTMTTMTSPIFIGQDLVSDEERFKCLLVNNTLWEVIVAEGPGGYTKIKFKKKD